MFITQTSAVFLFFLSCDSVCLIQHTETHYSTSPSNCLHSFVVVSRKSLPNTVCIFMSSIITSLFILPAAPRASTPGGDERTSCVFVWEWESSQNMHRSKVAAPNRHELVCLTPREWEKTRQIPRTTDTHTGRQNMENNYWKNKQTQKPEH